MALSPRFGVPRLLSSNPHSKLHLESERSTQLDLKRNANRAIHDSSSVSGAEVTESCSSYVHCSSSDASVSRREAALQVFAAGAGGILASVLACSPREASAADVTRPKFYELEGSGGVTALDIRAGTGETPQIGDKVAIHYYARLAAKQGWRFDSSYEHKDRDGEPVPYVFVVGDGKVIAGLDTAVRSMKEGGVRRVVIPPSQGYQNTTQEPIPPNFSDRQRLYTTIFNPTRLANGEGSTLGTLVFDIELLGIR